MGHVITSGIWRTSSNKGKAALISRQDIALAAACALEKSINGQHFIDLNGQENQAATNKQISATTDIDISVEQMSDADLDASYRSQGLPPQIARTLVSLTSTIGQDGRFCRSIYQAHWAQTANL